MDNSHLDQIRLGSIAWNEWRLRNPNLRPDLSDAKINHLAPKSTLSRHKGIFRRFQELSLRSIDLSNANVRSAIFHMVDFSGANLNDADLNGAMIRSCSLTGAKLNGADLHNTQFLTTDLTGSSFARATLGGTYFGSTKLANAEGFENAVYISHCHIDHFSLIHSVPLAQALLHACMVPEYALRAAELYARNHPYYKCFISYSHTHDRVFAGYLREALLWRGIPSWFGPQDTRNEKFDDDRELAFDLFGHIDEAERLILVISPGVFSSGWVGKEFSRNQSPVIPLLVEDIAEACTESGTFTWSSLVQRFGESVLDFRRWRDPAAFTKYVEILESMVRRPV
ncbi:MAG TPA: toll/interleukin-1 receptor domain-containing protein [Candidatus Angelobacter sp.]|jgi:uncharacterized protein YjbI with pentapeptide repeats|nr:toll/interleukin-1 receptor domain-containing protein [Candidatus Angelobacter sp.]